MQTFILEPLKGAGKIEFGLTKEEVRNLLGEPEDSDDNSDFFFGSDMRVDYDLKDKVEYIEFNGPFLENIKIELYGSNVFENTIDDFLALLKEKAKLNIEKQQEADTYVFPELGMAVWLDSFADEDETETETEEDDEVYIWSIGIGQKGYFESNNNQIGEL